MKDVYYGDEGLMPMVAAGFAVVATDYHGLGTEGSHQYVNKTAQARDVVYSIPAARAAVPAVSVRSGWRMATRRADSPHSALPKPNMISRTRIISARSRSPESRAKGDFFSHLSNTAGVGFYLAFMAAGMHARYPEFQPHDLFCPTA